jgi:hypothetical protein
MPMLDIIQKGLEMRAIIEIPDKQINDLALIAKTKKLPRAEIIRQAITVYISSNKPSAAPAFGLWAKHPVKDQPQDGLQYQEKMRAEW